MSDQEGKEIEYVDGDEDGEDKKSYKSFTPMDVQKYKLDKLMKNIEKPVEIPGRGGSGRKFPNAPDFVRNVMGSSAGAGSGEFHVYRHLRRKEYARLRHIEEQAKNETREAYQKKLSENKTAAELRTAKKREKRLKKKQKQRQKKKTGAAGAEKSEEDSSSDEDEEETKPVEAEVATEATV